MSVNSQTAYRGSQARQGPRPGTPVVTPVVSRPHTLSPPTTFTVAFPLLQTITLQACADRASPAWNIFCAMSIWKTKISSCFVKSRVTFCLIVCFPSLILQENWPLHMFAPSVTSTDTVPSPMTFCCSYVFMCLFPCYTERLGSQSICALTHALFHSVPIGRFWGTHTHWPRPARHTCISKESFTVQANDEGEAKEIMEGRKKRALLRRALSPLLSSILHSAITT